jgi:hypothetical protein
VCRVSASCVWRVACDVWRVACACACVCRTCGAHESSAEEVARRKGRRRREHATCKVEAVEGVLLRGGLGQQQRAIVKSRTPVLRRSCVWELMVQFAVNVCRRSCACACACAVVRVRVVSCRVVS